MVSQFPKASGLAVIAQDTGRVLMLQRGFSDESDPARGKYEFPGGHVDEGETPLEAAKREFGEETGMVPPRQPVKNTWRAGVYRGFVIEIPQESAMPINLPKDKRKRINPDDPDGDEIETLVWVHPDDMVRNPMLRYELKQVVGHVRRALNSEMTPNQKWGMRLEALAMRRGEHLNSKSACIGTSADAPRTYQQILDRADSYRAVRMFLAGIRSQ